MNPLPTPDESFLRKFKITGQFISVAPLTRGHIHQTYVSSWRDQGVQRRYVHQKINRYVFSEPELVMKNIAAVTQHINQKFLTGSGSSEPRTNQCTLHIVPTIDGQHLLNDSNGDPWRTYDFVEDTICIDFCHDLDQGYRAGKAFGHFENLVSDLAPGLLREPIARFQDFSFRYEQLAAAMKSDVVARAGAVTAEIDYALSQQAAAQHFMRSVANGELPRRITHGDPKVNNILFSKTTGEAVCIVDLDTCMPGSTLYDFGDLCRTTTVLAAEDEQDFTRVKFERGLFEAVARGFLEITGAGLCAAERQMLPTAPQIATVSLGVRFLTDHLNGDKYFHIHHQNHNLERARTQFQIARTMAADSEWISRTVAKCMPTGAASNK